jgi:hypothetical protein
MRPTLPFLAPIFRCTIGFAAAEKHTRCTKTELPHKPHVQRSDWYLSAAPELLGLAAARLEGSTEVTP